MALEGVKDILAAGTLPATLFASAMLVRAFGYAAAQIIRAWAALRLANSRLAGADASQEASKMTELAPMEEPSSSRLMKTAYSVLAYFAKR